MGFTELMLGKNFGDLNETQMEYLSDVYQSSQHLLSLVNDILDVAKIEAGKLELKPARINPREIFEQSLSIVKDKAVKRKIRLEAKIDRIPETLAADELRLKQILYNLLSNAVKFTEDGGEVCLCVRTIPERGEKDSRETGSSRERLEISVIDSGIGIRKEDMERIFEPFSQLETSLSRKYPGTGLGLSLTRTLVEMHGGRIWVESEGLGKGSAFRFTLPILG